MAADFGHEGDFSRTIYVPAMKATDIDVVRGGTETPHGLCLTTAHCPLGAPVPARCSAVGLCGVVVGLARPRATLRESGGRSVRTEPLDSLNRSLNKACLTTCSVQHTVRAPGHDVSAKKPTDVQIAACSNRYPSVDSVARGFRCQGTQKPFVLTD